MLRGRHILEEQKATCSVEFGCALCAPDDRILFFSHSSKEIAGPHLVPSPQQSPDGLFRTNG